MDKVIEKLKDSYIDEKYNLPWFLWLLSAPLRDIAKVLKLQKGIAAFFTSKAFLAILPFVTAIIGPAITSYFKLSKSPWIISLVSLIIGYLISMIYYFPQLTRFKSDHFHTGAYRALRKQEYNLFKAAFLDPKGEFYFKGVYDYVTSSQEGYRSIENIIHNFISIEKTQYESKIFSLEEKIKEINLNVGEITTDYDQFTQSLILERDELLKEFEYVIELLKDLNTLLFRIHNKGLTLQNLDILTGFTLYELKGNKLIQIADVHTSGVTDTQIELDDPKYSHYGAVKVIKDNIDQPYFNHPYPGHEIISFKMRIDNKGTWVYNFHFNDSNTKAVKLLKENGTIESKEIYRLIHALCLLSLDFKATSKEGAVNQ